MHLTYLYKGVLPGICQSSFPAGNEGLVVLDTTDSRLISEESVGPCDSGFRVGKVFWLPKFFPLF